MYEGQHPVCCNLPSDRHAIEVACARGRSAPMRAEPPVPTCESPLPFLHRRSERASERQNTGPPLAHVYFRLAPSPLSHHHPPNACALMDPHALPIPAPAPRSTTASAPASLPGSPPPRRASSEHVQLVRELWVLRERARVQAAERSFLDDLTRLLDRGVSARRRVRSTGSDDWVATAVNEQDVFESFPPPRGEFAPVREPPVGVLRREAEIARAQQRVTNLSPEFRARLEGSRDGELERRHSAGGSSVPRTSSWGALLAQRAVSSALDSAFRHELEGMLVRRGPREGRALYAQRGRGEMMATDGVEIGRAHTRRGDGRDVETAVRALREEVSALKHVIDASFDMQLDIQRAIRQEVAAAMHSANRKGDDAQSGTSEVTADSAASERSVANGPRGVRAVAGGACSICLDRRIDSLLYSCGHMCTCAQCGRQLIAHGETCPVCRAPVRDVVVAYMAA